MLQISDVSPTQQHLEPSERSSKDLKYLSDNLEFSENAASLFQTSAARRGYISWEDHYQFNSLEKLLATGKSRNHRPSVSIRNPIGVKTHSCRFEPKPNSLDSLPPIIKDKDRGAKYSGVGKMPSRKSTFSIRSIQIEPSLNWGDRIRSAANNFETICLRSDSLTRLSPGLSVSSSPRADLSPYKQVPEFVMEWEMGHKSVHQPRITLNENEILLENGLRFDKVLEPVHPPPKDQWHVKEQEGGRGGTEKGCVHGQRRWQDWPRPHRNVKNEGWLSVNETSELERVREERKKYLANKLDRDGTSPGMGEEENVPQSPEEDFFLEEEKDFTPSRIVEEWLQKWNMPTLVSTVTPADLLNQMNSVNQLVRLQAAAQSALLPDKLMRSDNRPLFNEQLIRLLTDESLKVRITAATVLSFIETEDTRQLESVLLEGADSSNRQERWLSSQALALMLVPEPTVLGGLSDRVVSDIARERSRALLLLGRLSSCGGAVHAVAADLVSAVNWKEKIAGCSLVPLIHNGPSRDLQDQLVYIMWHNWHSKVREAAARALGRAGKGVVIHDEIRRKLTDVENEDFRLDALHKIRELKPPLSLLVPGLLSCLEDSVISVRLKCIQLVGEMQIRDDRIVDVLIEQLKDDNWRVKLEAIKSLSALSSIASSPQEIVSQLLWAGRYDRITAVRVSAIQTLSSLAKEYSPSHHPNLRERVVAALTESLSSDTEDSVREGAKKGLLALGEEAIQDNKLVLAIRSEIKRLAQPAEIAASILQPL